MMDTTGLFIVAVSLAFPRVSKLNIVRREEQDKYNADEFHESIKVQIRRFKSIIFITIIINAAYPVWPVEI